MISGSFRKGSSCSPFPGTPVLCIFQGMYAARKNFKIFVLKSAQNENFFLYYI